MKSNAHLKLVDDLSTYPPVLDVATTSEIIQVSRQTVRMLIRTKQLNAKMVGKYYRIPRASLIEFMSNGGS